MQITVVGEASSAFPPERATISMTLGFEGVDRADVMARTALLASELAAHIETLKRQVPSPTTWSALLPASVRSWRPASDLPRRHEASWSARVRFRDFVALSEFIETWGVRDGVRISWVDWTLTEATRRREEAAVLTRAVRAARTRGEAMAAAAGVGSVRFLELTDPGLMGEASTPKAAGARGEMVKLQPEDVELTARVHAKFTTD